LRCARASSAIGSNVFAYAAGGSCCVPWSRRSRKPRAASCATYGASANASASAWTNDLWLVIHLMIAGRLHWRLPAATLGARIDLAAFDFSSGTLVVTEASSKRRASLHVLAAEPPLLAMDPGGIDVFAADLTSFRRALSAENQTLKRALTDPHLLSGNGSACLRRRAPLCSCGSIACATKQNTNFRLKSRRFAKRWPSTVSSANRVRGAARRCSASATPTMRPTIAPAARPAESCSPTAACLGYCGPTRRVRSKTSRSVKSPALTASRRCR